MSVAAGEAAGVDKREQSYNSDSDAWKNVKWETSKLSFGYTTTKDESDPNMKLWTLENHFIDKCKPSSIAHYNRMLNAIVRDNY